MADDEENNVADDEKEDEAALLREMIVDREKRIALIQRKTEEQKEKELRICQELEEISAKNLETQLAHQTEKTRSLHARQAVEEQLDAMHHDLYQQGQSLRSYAMLALNPQQVNDDQYVMRMQAQLCKAMHAMGIIDHQLELETAHSEALIKFQKESLAKTTEEKSQVELELMNELMKTDTELREVEAQSMAQLEDIRKEREVAEHQLADHEDDDEDEEKEEEEDEEEVDEEEAEEERQAKRELMKMLQEKQEEIEKLEKETQEQEETMRELEEQIQEIKAEKKDIMIANGTFNMRKAEESEDEDVVEGDYDDDDIQEEDDDDDEEEDADKEENGDEHAEADDDIVEHDEEKKKAKVDASARASEDGENGTTAVEQPA